jgi:hypothetical protein
MEEELMKTQVRKNRKNNPAHWKEKNERRCRQVRREKKTRVMEGEE